MARIAYVDHSYHRTTRSTNFLRDTLRARGHEVVDFWDDAWQGGPPVQWAEVQPFDVVIMFQSYCLPEGKPFRLVHPNVIYIPMLDQFGIWQGPMFNQGPFWEPFQGSKVVNFSIALHCLTTGFGIASHRVRYYQPPQAETRYRRSGLHGFLWVRRQEQIGWPVVRRLIDGTRFDSLHIHLAQDPGSAAPELPTDEEIARHNITTSTWFENKQDLTALIDKANVYFAPRAEEGIGQSFLEAMSRGACVVAANQGTMNEYILHGVNGLLFDHRAPHALDFSHVNSMGTQARASVVQGHGQWLTGEDALVEFILTPSEALYAGKYQHVFAVVDEVPAAPVPVAVPASLPPRQRTRLRVAAQRYAIFRVTRPLWHPVVRLLRRLAGRTTQG